MSQFLTGQTARDIYELAGPDGADDALLAMIMAEQGNRVRMGRALVTCEGYAPGTREFHAGTALYRVQW